MSSTSPSLPPDLAKLASIAFSDLTKPEEQLLRAAEGGDWSIVAKPDTIDEDEDESSKQARTIRCEVLRWLCTNQQASAKVDARGIKVVGALVKGRLDLSYANISFALEFEECDFPGGLDLKSARVTRLSLNGSKVASIRATNLVTLGDVSLSAGFVRIFNRQLWLTSIVAKSAETWIAAGGSFLTQMAVH